MLDNEINNILEKLDAYLTTLITKCKCFEKPYDFECVEKVRELRIFAENKSKWNKDIKRRSWN